MLNFDLPTCKKNSLIAAKYDTRDYCEMNARQLKVTQHIKNLLNEGWNCHIAELHHGVHVRYVSIVCPVYAR